MLARKGGLGRRIARGTGLLAALALLTAGFVVFDDGARPAVAHTGDMTAKAVCEVDGTYTVTYTLKLSNVPAGQTGSTKAHVGGSDFKSGWNESSFSWELGPKTVAGNGTVSFTQTLPGDTKGNGPWFYALTRWSPDGYVVKSDTRVEGLKGDCTKPSPKPEPIVKQVDDTRQSCEVGQEVRKGVETTDWVKKDGNWVKSDPVTVWGDWSFDRPLTGQEKVSLGCPFPPEPPVVTGSETSDGPAVCLPEGGGTVTVSTILWEERSPGKDIDNWTWLKPVRTVTSSSSTTRPATDEECPPPVKPSPTPSETPTVTPSETPTVTPSETPSETPTATPSETPSATPTATATQSVAAAKPTTTTPPPAASSGNLPSTGSSINTLLMALMGAGLLLAGSILLLAARRDQKAAKVSKVAKRRG